VSGGALLSQPFIYGRPVHSGEFLNRESELRTIFNRLRNAESTAIVGEPHIGKTSLLLRLIDETTQRAYLGNDAGSMVVLLLDLHPIADDYTPAAFWEEVLEPLRKRPGHAATSRWLEQAARAGYARNSLEHLFNQLGQRRRCLVLLLDEFERLLTHPNFQDPAFFALLRSLATRTGGLALVTASRLSVAEMNERGRGLLDIGSPFFNNFIEVRMCPFDDRTVNALLDWADPAFSSKDKAFIRCVAGRHPFLLQAMASALVETAGDDRYVRAAEVFYGRVSPHFDDSWNGLDDHARTSAAILGLIALSGRALRPGFHYDEIQHVDAFGPELRKLAERGLAEQVGKEWQFAREPLFIWRGEQWTVGGQAFAWWVREVAVAEARRVPSYDEWLMDRRYHLLVTQEQWDRLVSAVRSACQSIGWGVGPLARALSEQL